MDMHEDDELIEKSRDLFRQQEQDLNDKVLERLADIRRTAVEKAIRRQQKSPWQLFPEVLGHWFLETSTVMRKPYLISAVASLVVIIAITFHMQTQVSMPVDDLTILSAEDDLEMIEDLDFYHWLVEADING